MCAHMYSVSCTVYICVTAADIKHMAYHAASIHFNAFAVLYLSINCRTRVERKKRHTDTDRNELTLPRFYFYKLYYASLMSATHFLSFINILFIRMWQQ